MRTTYDKDLLTVKKGDIITETGYNGREYTFKLRVDRVNPKTISVTCIEGYMQGSGWKIIKPQQKIITTKFARVVNTNTYKDITITHEYLFYLEDKRAFVKEYVNGEYRNKSMIYDVKTDKPYIRYLGRRWILTDDYLAAVKSLYE